MTEPKDIETEIKERQELLGEISPWPWITDKKDCTVCVLDKNGAYLSGFDDDDFIATSPQFESDLIKECQKLKKQNQIMRDALEDIADRCNLTSEDAIDFSRSATQTLSKTKEIEE